MVKRRSWLVAGVSFLLLAGLSYWGVWRTASMMHQVGLAGWLPESGRTCEDHPDSQLRYCRITRGDTYREGIIFNRITRRPRGIIRGWLVTDSALWMQAQDSVNTQMRRFGGQPFSCQWWQGSPDLQMRMAWRFRRQDVRLAAYKNPEPRNGSGAMPPSWSLSVVGHSVERGCARERVTVRFLTPRELAAQLRRRMASLFDDSER